MIHPAFTMRLDQALLRPLRSCSDRRQGPCSAGRFAVGVRQAVGYIDHVVLRPAAHDTAGASEIGEFTVMNGTGTVKVALSLRRFNQACRADSVEPDPSFRHGSAPLNCLSGVVRRRRS
jgi:hypothetical protein